MNNFGGTYMKKLLVVVDYQNDFVTGSLGFKAAKELDKPISEKVLKYRDEGANIIYTMDTHGPAYLDIQEGKKLPIIHCQNGTDGWKLYGETGKVCEDAMTIGKHTFGSFDLAMFALNTGYDQIEICGVIANCCVMANAILLKTAQPEAEIIIDSKCVASPDNSLKEKALDVLESMQFTVINR